jgi:nucleoside phosphorylase
MSHDRTRSKVLVVEDRSEKVAKILEVLESSGLAARNDIDVAQSGFDARRFLRSTRYELMILDVVLPNRPEDAPKQDGGIELLRELMTREHLLRPRYVLGLTAYPEAFQTAAGEFAANTWAIVQYTDNDDSWHDPIRQLARHIRQTVEQSDSQAPQYTSDLCVVTALDIELRALRAVPWPWSALRVAGDATDFVEAIVPVSGIARRARVIAACAPRMGMVSAAVLAANMIRTFTPRIVAMVGICAGMREEVSLGDVVVADPSWDYQSGKYNGTSFEAAPNQLPLNSAVRRRVKAAATEETLIGIRSKWQGSPPPTTIRLHAGPFASGSSVLANKERLAALKLQHRKLVAIDMEAYGIYSAAADAPTPTPHALVIKGVSDFGDEEKTDSVRDYAAYVSAAVLRSFVETEYGALLALFDG